MAKKKHLSRHKFSGRNNGPARQRYWADHRLQKHKVRNLMSYNGMSLVDATRLWISTRKTRMKTLGK